MPKAEGHSLSRSLKSRSFQPILKPTDIQFITGLFFQITLPHNIQVEVGSRVYDVKAEEKRDVDVTFSIQESAHGNMKLAGYEVKDHTRSLDVTHVEQLVIKLKDLPALGA